MQPPTHHTWSRATSWRLSRSWWRRHRRTATVVFHSAVLPYVAPGHRQRFVDLVQDLDVTWISNEGEAVVPAIRDQLPRSADG
ncbi:hypothetical protein [Arthrobacter luteolus]|uniref:hypothetical protein n=1 Tax=Arthrobacter luteolus TaxID=98672 RepID=UPI0012ECF2CC|nr:hypothetical protein [Arthrobacter luteolus]